MNNIELRDYFAGQALTGLLANPEIAKSFIKDDRARLRRLGLTEERIEKMELNKAVELQEWHSMVAFQFAEKMLEEKTKEIK